MWMNEECTWGDQMTMVRDQAMKLTNMINQALGIKCENTSGGTEGDGGVGAEVWE
jgi:hypothetical protein